MSKYYKKSDLIWKCGVYLIYHTARPNRSYVGSTRGTFKFRWERHLGRLSAGDHHNAKLQETVNSLGIAGIRFIVIQDCDPELAYSLEQYWVNMICPWYNASLNVGNYKSVAKRIRRKPVLQYSLEGDFIKEFPSLSAAGKEVKAGPRRIRKSCKTGHYCKGYFWRFKKGEIKLKIKPRKSLNRLNSKAVCQYSSKGYFIKKYDSLNKAGGDYKMTKKISRACKREGSSGGFYWRYLEDVEVDGKIKEKIDTTSIEIKRGLPARPIIAYKRTGKFYKKYPNKRVLVKDLGCCDSVRVNEVDDELISRTYDFILFYYFENYPDKINPYRVNSRKSASVKCLKTGEIRNYPSMKECIEKEDISVPTYYKYYMPNREKFIYNNKEFDTHNSPYKPFEPALYKQI